MTDAEIIQDLKDIVKTLASNEQRLNSLARAVNKLADVVDGVEGRVDLHHPVTYTCPNCHRKVSKGARVCGLCSEKW